MARPSLLGLLPLGFAGLSALAIPAVAGANPAVQACEGKAAGDPCGVMKLHKPPDGGELQRTTVPGVCRSDECCDLDYSKGSPPQTVCHTCLACKQGPADATPPPAGDGPAKAEGEPPRAGADDPPAPSPPEKRGCHVGAPSSRAPGWLLAMGLWLLVCRRRN